MNRELLTETDIQSGLSGLDGWTLAASGTAITRTFKFSGFGEAFGWMTRAALIAEKIDHHPDWRNVYNRVEVSLTTHSAKGLTGLDMDLARAMDAL